MSVPGFGDVSHWINIDKLQGLLFFAQSIYDMTFNYTLDTFQAPIHTTNTLCHEYIEAYSEYENNNLKNAATIPIKEEIRRSYEKDPVVRKILGNKYNGFLKILIENSKNDESFLNYIRLLSSYLTLNYCDTIIDLLKIEIAGDKKSKIYPLTRLYVSTLLSMGYSQAYIFYSTKHFFFDPLNNEKVSSNQDLDQFLNLFSLNEKKYTAIVVGDEEISKLYSFSEGLEEYSDIDLLKKSYEDESKKILEIYSKGGKVITKIMGIEAFDHYSAKDYVKDLIDTLKNFYLYYNNSKNSEFIDYILLIDEETDTPIRIKTDSLDPLCKLKQLNGEKLQQGLDYLYLRTAIMTVEESYYSIYSSLNLNSFAVSSGTNQGKLINMWSAIEALVPYIADNSIISRVDYYLPPVLCRDYNKRIIDHLNKLLFVINNTEYNQILDSLPSDYSTSEKLLLLMISDSHKDLMDRLFKLLRNYPLMRYKIALYSDIFRSVKATSKLIKEHEKRIRWHLKRIYRVRNLIAHKGKDLENIPKLLENTNSYYHIFMDKILEETNMIQPLNITLNKVKFEYEKHIECLSNSSYNVNEDNFKILIFGYI